MRVGVKTSIEGFYKVPILGKILGCFRCRLPVIEGYEALLHVEYHEDSEEIPISSIKPVLVEPHGVEGGIDRWGHEPWMEINCLTMKFHPSVSGYVEWRVYFKDLKDLDTIVDDYSRAQTFKGDIGSDKNIRYYYKVFRVYSLHEVLMLVFTGVVTCFTILLFIIAIINFFG
jgi:hypothetical protein